MSTSKYPQKWTSYPHSVEGRVRYNPLCHCTYCSAQTFITLGRSAYTEQEFVLRAKKYKMNEVQQKVVDEMKLKLWNEATRGEIAG